MTGRTTPDGQRTWQARWRTPDGASRKKTFQKKSQATAHVTAMENAAHTGTYVDPRAGRVTFREYAEDWRTQQVHRPTTAAHVETILRRHAYPTLGDRPMASIQPTHVQAWVKLLVGELAPSTVGVVHRIVAGIFRAAVRNRKLTASPCEGIKLPKVTAARVTPLSVEHVAALLDAAPPKYRALLTLAAGTGMRQGEVFGLTVDRVDFLRRRLTVDRQLTTLPGRPPFLAPPKTPASVRVIPLPDVVLTALTEHLRVYPAGADGLVFTSDAGHPIRRTAFSARVWRPTALTAGMPAGETFHGLRHHYASLLIRHGESVKTVQARLGHASAAETLDTYSHLWPDSDDRTREAVDSAWQSSRVPLVSLASVPATT